MLLEQEVHPVIPGLILILEFHLCIKILKMYTKNISVILMPIFILIMAFSCNKGSINPYLPNAIINVTIDPNSTIFQQLNTPGGWIYLEEQPGIYIPSPSRGVLFID